MITRKVTIALFGATALLGASNSFATAFAPSTGNGELVLFAYDAVTGTSYAKNLGVRLDNILADSAVKDTAAGTLNYVLPSFSLTGDTNWTGFLSGSSGLDNILWSVLGADTVGNNIVNTPKRIVTTVITGDGLAPAYTNNNVGNGSGNLNTYFTTLNGALGANASAVGVGATGPFYSESNGGNFSLGFAPEALLGQTAQFYYATTSNATGGSTGGTNLAKVYQLASLTLTSAGLVAVVPTTEVPLPAAVWLFGSGLLGMFGVGRRRALKAA